MNGDIGKIPSGVVYTTSPDSQTSSLSVSVNDFSIINGVVDPPEPPSDVPAPGGSAAEAAHTPPHTPNTAASSAPNVPLEQLKQMLSSQLEYYFSRENLANDAYLLSQMDNDQYVPIWTVANFNQVKKLTKDIKLITEVLRESPNVQVDEEGQKVRPSHKRCIVILREIPDSTPLEEVKGLFTGKGCPKLISCEFAHNNSWYVTFENDEDAQKAYRFLREEVKEFQGKPIMARIKAKPMNWIPIPPVVSPLGTMKNGYRSPQAPAATTQPFDPATAFPPAQQRFLYNSNSLQSVTYGSPVQIYTFQQHQPFYSTSMLPPWGPSSPAYFEFGSVFSVNGLAPQASFAKGQSSRFLAGSRNNRRKRKEEEGRVTSSPGPMAAHIPRGAQFDLEDDAFPPLPGLETSAASPVPAPFETSPESTPVITSQSQRENRLSDVVKGTAKMKPSSNSSICISNCNTKDRDTGSPRPRSVSPPMLTPSQPMPPQLPTPPLTPDKTVPPVAATKCCTADKSTKTDDIVANVAASESPPIVADNSQPSTTNAATMTDITSPNPPPPSVNQQIECSVNQKLSYAQVAQHAKDKQSTDRAEKLAINTMTESEKKEACSLNTSQTSPRESAAAAVSVPVRPAVGRGTVRAGADGLDRERGPRRRDSLLRFNSRHRSPK